MLLLLFRNVLAVTDSGPCHVLQGRPASAQRISVHNGVAAEARMALSAQSVATL